MVILTWKQDEAVIDKMRLKNDADFIKMIEKENKELHDAVVELRLLAVLRIKELVELREKIKELQAIICESQPGFG